MVDPLAATQRILAMIMAAGEIGLFGWLAAGGILYLIKGIGFFIDCKLVGFISYVFDYFKLIAEGELFNTEIINAIMAKVYVFIGLFVFFRLAMTLIKYIMSPDLISDQKAGMQTLIKRIIVGMAGILLVPTIFKFANSLQASIIKDQVLQSLFIPEDMAGMVKRTMNNGGRFIGTYILTGFVSPSASASDKVKREFDKAVSKGDLSLIDINSGGFMGMGYKDHDYTYFFIISTVVLGYVLYLLIKFGLDLLVRFLKLLIFQMLAPIVMVEYMINGSDDGAFKNWRNAVLSTYLVLFIRYLTLWFLVFIVTLMQETPDTYTYGSLLANNDFLLRAFIIVATLGFIMDLPKIIGSIFGLDLEQESSATKVLKTVGGAVKGVAFGALAFGGAAAGTAFAQSSSAISGTSQHLQARKAYKKGDLTKEEYQQKLKGINAAQRASTFKSLGGFGKSALGQVPGLSSASQGFSATSGAGKEAYNSKMANNDANVKAMISERKSLENEQKKEGIEAENQRKQDLRTIAQSQITNNPTVSKEAITDSMVNTDIVARLKISSVDDLSGIKANVNASMTTLANGQPPTVDNLVQSVNQELGQKLSVPASDVTRIVNEKAGDKPITADTVNQVVEQVVKEAKNPNSVVTQEVNQVVNQVMGSVPSAKPVQPIGFNLK